LTSISHSSVSPISPSVSRFVNPRLTPRVSRSRTGPKETLWVWFCEAPPKFDEVTPNVSNLVVALRELVNAEDWAPRELPPKADLCLDELPYVEPPTPVHELNEFRQ
jgi:hypothetical protein